MVKRKQTYSLRKK